MSRHQFKDELTVIKILITLRNNKKSRIIYPIVLIHVCIKKEKKIKEKKKKALRLQRFKENKTIPCSFSCRSQSLQVLSDLLCLATCYQASRLC